MKKIVLALVLSLLAMPFFCSAENYRPGPYVSAFLGVSAPRDTDATFTDFTVPATVTDRVEFDPGIDSGAAIGYDFGTLRLEGEFSYKYSTIKSVTDQTNGIPFANVDGNIGAFSMMMNGFFDFHNHSAVTPYIGGGIGFANLHLSDTFGIDTTTGIDTLIYPADDTTVFAYQGGAGIDIAINRQFSIDLGYRYFGTSSATFSGDVVTNTKMKFESHNGIVGFRAKF